MRRNTELDVRRIAWEMALEAVRPHAAQVAIGEGAHQLLRSTAHEVAAETTRQLLNEARVEADEVRQIASAQGAEAGTMSACAALEAVRSEGSTALEAVRSEGSMVLETVRSEGSTVLETVRSESSAVLEAVRSESTTAIAEVRMDSRALLHEVREGSGTALAELKESSGTALTELTESSGAALAELREGTGAALQEVKEGTAAALEEVRGTTDVALAEVQQRTSTALEEVQRGSSTALEEVRQGTNSALEETRQETGAALREVRQVTETALREVREGTAVALKEAQEGVGAALGGVEERASAALREVHEARAEATAAIEKTRQESHAAVRGVLDEGREELLDFARKEAASLLAEIAPPILEVVLPDSEPVRMVGHRHRALPDVLTALSARCHILLVGPAGTGKSMMAKQAAEALGLEFQALSLGPTTPMSKIFGYYDANGHYHDTPFRRAFEDGGLMLLDELDSGHPGLLAELNQALAIGTCAFADGMVTAHQNFRLVATANTYGTGGDRQYVGRQALDAATLDRFLVLEVPVDEELEEKITLAHAPTMTAEARWVLEEVRRLRAVAAEKRLPVMFSPRASIDAAKLLQAGASVEQALQWRVVRGMSAAHRAALGIGV